MTTPTLHRALVVSFDDTTWTAVVFLDGGSTEIELPVGEWLPSALFDVGDQVAVLLFDPTNPYDGLVLGPYGAVSDFDYPPLAALTAGHTLQATGAAAAAFTGPLGARVTRTTAQTIPNNTSTAVAFTSERYDTGAFHDNSTNNSRLTVPAGAGGYYLLGATILWQGNATGRRNVFLQLNGATLIANIGQMPLTTGNTTAMNLAIVQALSAGDYVEVIVAHTAGADLDLTVGTGAYAPDFWIHRLL